jgi:hypothetical protein
MNYMITFFGHIDATRRPRNEKGEFTFPEVVRDLIFVQAGSIDAVVQAANDASHKYIKDNGMSVGTKPHLPDVVNRLDTERVWVPMYMITYISLEVKTVEGEIPQMINSGGDLKFSSGKDLRLN